MMDDCNVVLSSTEIPKELVYLCLAFALGMLLAWLVPFWVLKNKPQVLTAMVSQGYILRMVTVTVVVIVAGLLALVGKLTSEATAAILSGVAGYVLGSGRGHPCEKRRGAPQDTASPDDSGARAKGIAKDNLMLEDNIVTSVFKPAGEDVQLLIVHSTQDKLGSVTVDDLKRKLNQDVKVVAEERIASFGELVRLMQKKIKFNVFLLLAHGDKLTNATWFDDDKDVAGRELSVNTGELWAALNGHVENKLCLFGVCYAGTDDLATAICKRALASACIAPRANSTIFRSEIVEGYGSLLNELQKLRSVDVGWKLLHSALVPTIPEALVKKLSVVPPE